MFVLPPEFSVGGQFRRMLEMYGESVTRDARVERLVLKSEFEAKLLTVVRNCSAEIIDEKLRGYPSKVSGSVNRHCRHLIPPPVSSWTFDADGIRRFSRLEPEEAKRKKVGSRGEFRSILKQK